MEIQTLIISAFITVFSLGLLIVSLVSYRKYKNLKLLFVSGVFLVFFIKGIILSLELFSDTIAMIGSDGYTGLFDLLILILLFIATLKR